jgi:hypothetical protein
MQPIAARSSAPRRTLDHPQQETRCRSPRHLNSNTSRVGARGARRHAPSASRHPAFDGNLGTDVLVDQDEQAHWIIYQRWETVEHDEAYRRLSGRRRSNHRAASDARRAAGQNEVQHYRRVTPWHRRRDHQDLRPRHHPPYQPTKGRLGEICRRTLSGHLATQFGRSGWTADLGLARHLSHAVAVATR